MVRKPESHARFPTCISDFDSIIEGGLPAGSTVILQGDVGAGQSEFAYTTCFKSSKLIRNPKSWKDIVGRKFENSELPSSIHYISLSRSRDMVVREVEIGFKDDLTSAFLEDVTIHDLSDIYLRNSIAPMESGGLFESSKQPLLEHLVDTLDSAGEKALIIIDSLTDLATSPEIKFADLVAFLKSLRKTASQTESLHYLVMVKDILDARQENLLLDCVEGVLEFEWAKHVHSSRRQRYMYVQKFMAVLPYLTQEKVSRFDCMVNARNGFIVLNTVKI
jgi:KaiC/GvpD/RAD55 family RecA-like ATPase